jgi:hypothetical protein
MWDLSVNGIAWTWERMARGVIDAAHSAMALGSPVYAGPLFSIVDLTNDGNVSIKVSDQWSVASNSALASLLLIASQRAGVTMRADIDQSSGAIALKFNTVVSSQISWDSDAQLLPASAERFTVNLGAAGTDVTRSGSPDAYVSGGVSRFNLSVNAGATFDDIYLVGGTNWWACTLTYQATGAQLAKGWDAALEADWDAASDSEKSNGTLAPVFSRFVIRSDWGGAVYPTQGGGGGEALPMSRSTSSGEPHNGGWDGLLTTTGKNVWTKGKFQLTKTLPWQAGYNWDLQDPATVDQTREMDQPQAYVYDGAKWYTLAEYAEIDDVQIRIDDDGSIVVGPLTVAKKIAELLDATGHVVAFTVGIKHWIDLAVSWINPAAPPADAGRVLVRECPRQMTRNIANGTIIRIGSTGYIVQRTAHTQIASDIPDMQSALRRMSAWYGTPAVDFSWSYEGVIVPLSTINAGQLVTSATIPYAVDGTTASVDVLNVVTQIQWDFSGDTPTTSYTTARMVNDIEARQ